MQIRRFAKPFVAALLAAGLFGLTAGPAVSAPVADTGWGFRAHTNDTGWGKI